MREINKFLVFVLIAFLATSAKAATGQKKAAFSIHCKRPGIDCEVVGDKSSITTITSCSSPASWKPAAGQAYLLKLDKVNECLEKTQIRCDRNLIWLHNAILNGYDEALILCDDATSYDITYDSNQESLWQLDGITWSYQKRLCEGTGGKYQVSTGKCDCGNGDDEFSDSGCMCKYGDYKFINIDGEGCSGDLWAACHMSGGKLKVKDAFDTCNCPSELNLIQTETKSGCLCKLGFTWQNPMNKQLGCVEKGKKLNINLTIKSNSGEKLSGVTVKYSDESGKSHETLTDSNGTLKISNMPNTSYAVIAHDGYAPTTLSAVVLSSNTDLVLYQISQEHKGEYYQACVTQPENSSRAASGIQIKTNDSVRDNWVYCGGYINDKDCGNEAKIIGTDNIVYKCVVDPATKNGTWTPIDVQQLDRCMDHYSQIFCERYGKFEYMLYEDEGKIIALRGHADKVMSDGNIYSSAAWDSVCYQDVSDCETNKISCGENICNKLETGPKWGQEDSESQITLNDDVSSDEYDEESETSSNTSPNITADDIANRLNELGLEDDNKTDTNIKPEKTRLEQAEENYKKAKENEQSLANRTLTSATTAATGLGMMAAASARSEQKADADAEQDMAAYLATFKCEYGKGMSTTAGNEEITLPGGNELLNYYQEYKSLADSLKSTKKALGLRSGIESEVVYDKAESGLYKYASTGITTGAYTSLSRALTDTEGADAAAWNAQKEDSAKKLKTGVIAAGAGIVGGMVGNYLINRNYKKTELQKKIDKVVEEVEEIAPEYVIPEFNAPVYERPQLEMPEPQLDTSGLRSQLPEIMSVHPRHLNLSGDSTFASGKSDIKDPTAIEALIARLTDTVSMLTDEQKVCIKITGHTDRTQYAKGSKMTNQKLSEQRAQSVQDYLKRGLADYGDKIIYEPVTGEADKQCTKDLYPKNNDPKCRRVDIEIQDCSVPTDQ